MAADEGDAGYDGPGVWVHNRIHHRGLHGHKHIDRQRAIAITLIVTALARVGAWTLLTICYAVGVGFAVTLFKSVAFVALISMFALILTDWGQMAASLAQLNAADAHGAAEHNARALAVDYAGIEHDLAELADLQPGPEARLLAATIREKLHVGGTL